VGETERNLRHRIKEHRRESSPVGAHLIQEDHQLDKDCVKILSSETKWFERGVKEAIHIAAERPSLNRDRGRHNLPAVYRSLVQSRGRDVLLTIHVDWTVGSHTAVVLMKTSSVESKATRKWQYFVERLV
jgi:hypothetical protein